MASNDVNSVQETSQSLMTDQYNLVKNFIQTLQSFTDLDQVSIPDTDNPFNIIDEGFASSVFQSLNGLRPTFLPTPPSHPAVPSLASLGSIADVTVDTLPDFTATPYSPVLPATPSTTLPTAPATPTLNTSPTLPTAPSFTLPAAPTFTSVTMPSPQAIQLPTFDSVAPTTDLTAPADKFVFSEQDYTSVLSDALKVKLLNDIENGGYGIEIADERALWDRERERTAAEANARIEEALRVSASRGFPLPLGADMAVVAAAQQEALEKISSVDREIALKRADMYVENRKFSIQAATEVESLFINYRSAMMERMLNAAKAVVELGVAIFNAKKDKYLADIQAYQSYATVFESKVRAELAKVEIYKAQIEAAGLQVDMQKAQVEIYTAQVEGLRGLISLYQAQMDGVKVLMEVEHNKIDLFGAQMQGYRAQIDAKQAEFGLYEAQIHGEVAKVESYAEQARAYAARIQGYEAKAQAQATRVSAQKAVNDSRIDAFRASLDLYRSDLQQWQIDNAQQLERYRADIALFGVQSDNYAKQLNFGFQSNVENNKRNDVFVQRQVAEAERTTAALFKLMDWRLSSAKYGTDSATQLAVAAAQQITGLTSLLKT